jgi:hypothetical protein
MRHVNVNNSNLTRLVIASTIFSITPVITVAQNQTIPIPAGGEVKFGVVEGCTPTAAPTAAPSFSIFVGQALAVSVTWLSCRGDPLPPDLKLVITAENLLLPGRTQAAGFPLSLSASAPTNVTTYRSNYAAIQFLATGEYFLCGVPSLVSNPFLTFIPTGAASSSCARVLVLDGPALFAVPTVSRWSIILLALSMIPAVVYSRRF